MASNACRCSTCYFYPRPPRGGRRRLLIHRTGYFAISIHALREEGDLLRGRCIRGTCAFLSTPSARRATIFSQCSQSSRQDFYPRPPRGGRPYSSLSGSSGSYFYPRPPRGGRPAFRAASSALTIISIHALREEGDAAGRTSFWADLVFLSTPSARRATVSIGSQSYFLTIFLSTPSARRATQKRIDMLQDTLQFLSTPSARRAT